MVETMKCPWKNDPRSQNDQWSGWHCSSIDRTSHIQCCSGYADLRETLDLSNDEHLTLFFRRVIERQLTMMKTTTLKLSSSGFKAISQIILYDYCCLFC